MNRLEISQVAGGLGAHRASGKGGRAGGAVRDGGGGGLAALIDALRPRPVKATPASAKGSGRTSATTRRTAANDTVVMDQVARDSVCLSSTHRDGHVISDS